jgi:hypothetical protein
MEKKKKESFMLISMAVGTKNGLGKSVRRWSLELDQFSSY